MEKLLARKLELWLVGILCVLGVLGAIVFSNIAVHTAKGGEKAGAFGEFVLFVSDISGFVHKLEADNFLMVHEGAHIGKAGFSFSYEPGTRPDAGYLIHTRFDGDDLRSYVDLYDLNNQRSVHHWAPDIDAINSRSKLQTGITDIVVDKSARRWWPNLQKRDPALQSRCIWGACVDE